MGLEDKSYRPDSQLGREEIHRRVHLSDLGQFLGGFIACSSRMSFVVAAEVGLLGGRISEV